MNFKCNSISYRYTYAWVFDQPFDCPVAYTPEAPPWRETIFRLRVYERVRDQFTSWGIGRGGEKFVIGGCKNPPPPPQKKKVYGFGKVKKTAYFKELHPVQQLQGMQSSKLGIDSSFFMRTL